MTTSTLQLQQDAPESAPAFEISASPTVQATDPAKLAKALNAVLGLDLGVEVERMIRAEVREALR